MDKLSISEMTVTDYFAINIFNTLYHNSWLNKKDLIKESYELAEYMTELKQKFEEDK